MPEKTRKAYKNHYEEKLHKRNQKIGNLEAVTIRWLEEEHREQEFPQESKHIKQEDQENKGPQKINPMEFLTKKMKENKKNMN